MPGGNVLPPLHRLPTNVKRGRVTLPPCHKELRYEDGEVVNQDRNERVQGGSAKFTKVKSNDIPFGETLTTDKQISELSRYTQTSWDTVVKELYSNRQSTSTKSPDQPKNQYPDEAFVRGYGNQERSQFYLLMVSEETTLAHIQPDGDFWNVLESDTEYPVVEDVCYTNGFIWTNPSTNWAWKSTSAERLIRVRVDIPATTQVIIDRAPVYGGVECQFDKSRESLFPDVLLGPAKFIVTKVVRYQSNKNRGTDSNEEVLYVEPRERGHANNDEEYAQLRVFDSNEFVDVRLKLVEQVTLPDPVDDRPGPGR